MGNGTSYKWQVERIDDNHFVLPKLDNMHSEVHAYLSDDLYNATEPEMWEQAVNAASYDGVIAVYLVPDCHLGFSVPIGSIIVTDNTIINAAVGYDVSCGLIAQRVNLSTSSLKSRYNRERLITEVCKRVATGLGSNRPALMPVFSEKKLEEVFMYGAKALGFDSSVCERVSLPVSDKFDPRKITKAYDKALAQLGSSGSSNHFPAEVDVDIDDGSVWTFTHCGSRGYGYQGSEEFFYRAAVARNIPSNKRGSSWLYADEELGKEYYDFHNAAANYAIANRFVIAMSIQEALQEVYGATAEVYYDISHNLVQQETLVLPDGSTKKGFVHRKGATRAMPAKHPDLYNTPWYDSGHPVLVPGSSYSGSCIMMPEPNAHQTACSVNHGAGRSIARNKAKKNLAHKQEFINDEMYNVSRTFNGVTIEGIVINSKNVPLDENQYCYKSLDDVIGVLTANKFAKIIHRLYPVANIKSKD
jgi:tRNA-splicing ligase RtcB (3'-phosphate/5'-hydroxy nucleic acid ligase)